MPANEEKRSQDFMQLVEFLSKCSWSKLNTYNDQESFVFKTCGSIYQHIEEGTLEARNEMGGISASEYYDLLSSNEKAVFIIAFLKHQTMAQYWEEQEKLSTPRNPIPPSAPNMPTDFKHQYPQPSAPPPSYDDYQQFSRLSVTPERAAELLTSAFNDYNQRLIGIRLNPFRALRDKTFFEALTLFEANLSLNTFLPIVELYLQASAPGCWSSLFCSSEPPRLLQAITPPLCEIFGTNEASLRFHASRWVETQSSAAVNPSYA